MSNKIETIYHYTTLDKAIRLILPNMQLRLSPLVCTNDPRENKYFQFERTNVNKNKPLVDDTAFSNELRKNCKTICFSYDDINNLGAGGYSYSRMWTHYGGNHQGVCIELDREKFIEENKSKINPSLMRKIKYVPPNPHFKHKLIDEQELEKYGIEKYVKRFRKKHLAYLYFTKFKEWQSEKEIRVLHFSDDSKDEFCFIKNSITRVFLGYDIIKMIESLPELKELCKNIQVIPLEYVEGSMSVNTEVANKYDSL